MSTNRNTWIPRARIRTLFSCVMAFSFLTTASSAQDERRTDREKDGPPPRGAAPRDRRPAPDMDDEDDPPPREDGRRPDGARGWRDRDDDGAGPRRDGRPGPPGDRGPGRPGPRERGGPGAPPRAMWSRMDEPEREHMESFMEEHFPKLVVELGKAEADNPRQFERRMNRIAPRIREVMDVMERDPERGVLLIKERRLDFEAMHLAAAVRRGDGEPDRVRRRVRDLSCEMFDLRQQRRHLEIRKIEARLDELKARVAEAEAMRDKLIEKETAERLERIEAWRQRSDSDDEAAPDLEQDDEGPYDRPPPRERPRKDRGEE